MAKLGLLSGKYGKLIVFGAIGLGLLALFRGGGSPTVQPGTTGTTQPTGAVSNV